MNSQVVPSLDFLYCMEEKQIVENLKPGLNLGIEAIFKINLFFLNKSWLDKLFMDF